MVELAQEMVHRIAKNRVLAHAAGGQRQAGPVADTPKDGHRLAALAAGDPRLT